MNSPQEFNCIFCKETFEKKEDLQIHFRKHGDPNFNPSQKGKTRPQTEAQSSVEKKSDEVEMVSCDVCSEMFPTISKAITHKHKVHPDHDAKYFCPWCGKLFTMKHLYNKHLQSNHVDMERSARTTFHCDACDVDFFLPSAMLYHNKFFHRQDTDLPTIGQSKKLKMWQQEALQIYYCAFCGDEYDNKVNLHKHTTDDHGDENQSPEEILRCPLCEAIFYHLDAYEVHLTFHSADDLYSEKNEIFEQIEEFSLETVPPVVEKVENVEPQEDVESAMNAVGIDKFLEMVMGDNLEKDSDGHKSKSKKHKKHKKKKKEAITLDEFLSMNKDVFGEGIDFQGIEEVPTQVVAKRLKQKKPSIGTAKAGQSSELEKLKKQGIVVKMKTTKKPVQCIKANDKIATKPIQSGNKPAINVQSTPDEVLSKLINQTNSQIKIVKKSSQENQEPNQQEGLGGRTSTPPIEDNSVSDKRAISPENIEVECDVNMPSEYTSSENEAKDENDKKVDTSNCDNNSQSMLINNHTHQKDNEYPEVPEPTECTKNYYDKNEDSLSKTDDTFQTADEESEMLLNDDNIEKFDPITTLKSTGSITIKSVTQNTGKPVIKPVETPENKNKIEEKSMNDEEFHEDEPLDNSTNNSLNALKHLSHLITVKSVVPKKSSNPSSPLPNTEIAQKEPKITQPDENSDLDEDDNITKETARAQIQAVKEKSINSIKSISRNITIKPVSQSTKTVFEKSDDGIIDDDNHIDTLGTKPVEKAMSSSQLAVKVGNPLKNQEIKHPSPKRQNVLKLTNSTNLKETKTFQEKQSNINLLKHLTNVTAKPISAVKNIQQTSNITPHKQNLTQNIMKKQEINKEIEIFSIDDSDDEPGNETAPPITKTSSPNPIRPENKCIESFNTLKNISKNVTVKPINQQPTPTNRTNVRQSNPDDIISQGRNRCSMSDFSDEDDDQNTLTPTNLNTVQQRLKLQNDHLKNTLRNLGKHITVKSGNPSPNSSIKSNKDYNSRDNFDMNEAGDSDDSNPSKVKITEMTDENDMSGDEMVEKSNNIKNKEFEENMTVKSPEESNSDHENIDEAEDDDFSDLEYQIKANTLKKPVPNTNKIMNFKNMNLNKNITIKSLNDKKGTVTKDTECNQKNIIPNLNSALSIKPMKQTNSEGPSREESFANKKNMMNAAQVKRSIINQNQSLNQSVATSSQQNTVNKEVTVKTFQTKTVIQEITTTVTKTIKTVNQTVKQEVQSTSQNNVMKFQKIQGMKSSNQQVKNFQGVTVRHATPVAGTKIRGGLPPNMASNIRPNQIVPCNQLVPVRPVRNTARMSVPRMPAVKRNTPPSPASQPRPAMGRPLKISPNVVNTKRTSEEPMGHFSCFKKPKESLIPGSEIPSFGNEQGGESTVQFSSSQMSRSNFTSATKTVRGNTVVTQMKSEVSSSSQQLEKLNSVSGLKIVKTSQSKQAMKVEEKCEMSPSKRNTLDAIEKLQKQGLLIKKPRIEEVSNESDHSDVGEDYITEEPDD